VSSEYISRQELRESRTEKSKSKVTVIIPNYNGAEHLQRLLASVAEQTYHDYQIIIIDDCSPDRWALEYINSFAREHDHVRLLENPENLGFVRTCNRGFALADGDYVCILTNDTEVATDFVERNVKVLDADTSIGVLSCIIVDDNGNNWFSGGLFERGVRVNLKDDFDGVRAVDWVAGTACFYRKKLLDEIGLLDETYVMYHEDVDFGQRVRRQSDYKVCIFSDKLVTHYLQHHEPLRFGLAKLARAQYYGHRNHVVLAKKYCPEYLRRILLSNLREIARLPLDAIRSKRPKSVLVSGYVAVMIIAGILAGLLKKVRRQPRCVTKSPASQCGQWRRGEG
jgi:GT2 family glycosyltransferase